MVGATIYIRWSSEAQTGRDSLRRQLEAARRYAADHGLDVRETIIDEATSAFSGSHLSKGRLGEFLKRVEAGEIATPHHVLVESFDRLNRQAPLDALVPFTAMMNAGLTIITLMDGQSFTKESLSSDGGLRLLMSLLVMVRAHEESATKGRRVSAAWERKRQQATSVKLTNVCPAWLRLRADRSTFDVDEGRAEVVRRIFRETADGIGKAALAARLNAEGLPAFRGLNGWHGSAVQKLVASDTVLGIFQPHILQRGKREPWGEPVRGYYPPIVDAALVERARAAVIARRTGASGPKGSRYPNLLAGLARCGSCRGKMEFVAKGPGEDYLACSAARRRQTCAWRTHFNYPALEEWVLSTMASWTCIPSKRERPTDDLRHREMVATKVQGLTTRLRRLVTEFVEDAGPEITDAIRTIQLERDAAASELRVLDDRLMVAANTPTPMAARARLLELRQTLASDDHAGRFAARAEIAQLLRSLRLELTLAPQDRTVILSIGEEMEARGSCVQPRPTPLRDKTSGRFRGTSKCR
jgi:DNA invertase Pin-like site-specific DNA recombinase